MTDKDYSILLKDKIANIIIFFTDDKTTSLKRIIKLMFIADQISVKKNGVPISWLKYYAWVQGPVPSQLYLELEKQAGISKNENLDVKEIYHLEKFIKANAHSRPTANQRSVDVVSKNEFDKSEFMDYELEILEDVKSKYGNWSNTKLVDFTHGKGSLWGNAVSSNGLKRIFNYQTHTDIRVSFFPILRGNKLKAFVQAQESLEYQSSLM